MREQCKRSFSFRALASIAITGICTCTAPVTAQSNEGAGSTAGGKQKPTPVLLRADQLAAEGKYGEAQRLYGQELARLERELGEREGFYNPLAASIYFSLGDCLKAQNKDDEAALAYENGLTSRLNFLPDKHPDITAACHKLADFVMDRCKRSRLLHEDADYFLRWALSNEEAEFGENSPKLSGTLAQLGDAYLLYGRTALAQESFERALPLEQEKSGKESAASVHIYSRLGRLAANDSCFPLARVWFQQVLDIKEKALGNEHLDLVPCLLDLSTSLPEHDQFGQKRAVLERALAIADKLGGSTHPAAISALEKLAESFDGKATDEKADRYLSRLLAFYEGESKINYRKICRVLTISANSWYWKKNPGAAAKPLQRIVQLRETHLAGDTEQLHQSLSDLSAALMEAKDYGSAQAALEKALRIAEKLDCNREEFFGNPVVRTLFALQESLMSQGKYDEALAAGKKLIERATHCTLSGQDSCRLYMRAADALVKLGKFADAEPLIRTGIRLVEETFIPHAGPLAVRHAERLESLSVVLRQLQKNDEAQKLEERAKKLRGA